MSTTLTQFPQEHTPPGNHHPILICVVDDSPTVCAIVRVTLEALGHTIRTFPDGFALWQWLAQQAVLPALLLLDIELPTVDGYELARHLRQHPRYQAIALIMLSSRDSFTDRLRGRVVGARAYLTKPFTMQQLHEAVQAVLAPTGSSGATTSATAQETY